MVTIMPSVAQGKPSILLIIYLLVVFGYTFSLGFYYLPGFLVLTLAFLLLVAFFFLPQIFDNFEPFNFSQLLKFSLLISASLSLVCYGGLQQEKGALYNLSLFLLMLCVILIFSYFFEKPKADSPILEFKILNFEFVSDFVLRISDFVNHLLKYRFWLLIAIALILRIFMVFSSPNPQIDVFDILKNGPKALLQGQNPYSQTYNKIYIDAPANYFAYSPGSILAVLPFVAIFNDPRFAMISAEILTAILIYIVGKNELLALLFLFNPRFSFVTEQSWLDPLIPFFLLLFYYLYKIKEKESLALFIFGFIAVIKQSFIFFPVFLLKIIAGNLKKWLWPTAAVILTLVPFLLWNAHDLIYNVFTRYFVTVSERIPLTHRSLTLFSFWFEQFQKDIPSLILWIIPLLFLTVVFIKQQKQNWLIFFAGITVFHFALFFFSNAAFLNFYYLISQLILLTIVIYSKESNHESQTA